jgi:hypothetical protein
MSSTQQPDDAQRKADLKTVRKAIEKGETPLLDTYGYGNGKSLEPGGSNYVPPAKD